MNSGVYAALYGVEVLLLALPLLLPPTQPASKPVLLPLPRKM